MTTRNTTHATFVIEREYSHPPARVFAAYASSNSKAQWFVGADDWERSNHKLDFRVGGRESVSGGPPGGTVHAFSGTHWDIVENERIVVSYEMHLDKTRISVSLGTTEFKPSATGTKLVYTEQGAFLDGFDDAGSREHGTRELLNQLDAFLNR